jgi:putative ABC transport system permease protein
MILLRAGIRNLVRHPWQSVLAVIGVALGVAVVTAVDLANESAHRAFRVAAETVAGRATHQIVGGPQGLPEGLYREIRVNHHFRGCAPVLTADLRLAGPAGSTLQLVGVDPFAEPPIRSFSSQFQNSGVLKKLLTQPGSALLLAQSARRLGLKPGDNFEVELADGRRRLTLAGLLEARDELERLGLDALVVTDIATAQELTGRVGRLSRIDLVVPEAAAGERLLGELRGLLPAEATLVTAGARAGALEQLTRAFRLNLTSLSLLALVVGMFLIYNTMVFSVIRRRRTIGLLRAVGVTRSELLVQLLGEALLLGIAGTAAGLVLGTLLGQELTRLVTRTINDLYFVLQVREVPLLPGTLIKGALLGVLATLAAALPPALEATGAPPRAVLARSFLEARSRKLMPYALGVGLLMLLLGGGVLAVESWGISGSFAGLFAVIVGYALLVPAGVVVLARLLRPVLGALFGMIGRMAARGVLVSLSRTGVATAALVVAVSATIGVGIMVGSFRLTVQNWLESWLRADYYLSSADGGDARRRPPLDPALVQRLSQIPGASASLTRRVTLTTPRGPLELFAAQVPKSTFTSYRFKEGSAQLAWAGYSRGSSVLVSEPFSYRHRLHLGDSVQLPTRYGTRSFPIAGVVYDYGSDAGIVMLSRVGYFHFWGDSSVDGMGFYAENGETPAHLAGRIRELAGKSRVRLVSNKELRRATMAVFDRTFAITGVLRILTMVVAFVGILSALMAMQVERARELAVLRALGLTPAQVWGVISGETLIIGLAAGLLSLPLGILQALVLIFVVNRRSFGWTMEPYLNPELLVQAVLLSLCAAFLAGIYPSIKIARLQPALALKEEE